MLIFLGKAELESLGFTVRKTLLFTHPFQIGMPVKKELNKYVT